MPQRGRASLQSLLLLAFLLAGGSGVWWLINNAPAPAVSPEQLTSARTPDTPAATIDESIGATDLSFKGLEFIVNSEDGKMSMKVEAREGTKLRSQYSIREGSLQFFMNEKNTLVIGLNNASYSKEAGLVKVSGTLIGRIPQGGQYFKAEELSWDQSKQRVSTKEVSYVSPNLSVTGEQMSIDMLTGEVTFDGAVEVGI